MCNNLFCPISREWVNKARATLEKLEQESIFTIQMVSDMNKKVDEIIKDHELKQEGGM